MNYSYTLRKGKRRSLTIQVREDASILVKAPHSISQHQIESFLNEKSRWIEGRIAKQQERLAQRPVHKFNEGEIFQYLGEGYRLKIIPPADAKKYGISLRQPLDLNGEFLLHSSKTESARKHFIKWYQNEARAILAERVGEYCSLAGLDFTTIKLSNARTRWGSCSSKGSLNFNWRIIMAPMEVVDYLVTHEVAHLKHHNHSESFWGLVEELYPGYKANRKWLKENGHRLAV